MEAKRAEKEIKIMRSLATTAAALYDYNYKQDTPENRQIYLPIEKALEEITPAWRSYTKDIYATDDFLDLIDTYSRELQPRPGAVIVSQWGDRYTMDSTDAKGLSVQLVPSTRPGIETLFFNIYGEGAEPAAPLGKYRGRLVNSGEHYGIEGARAEEAARGIFEALKIGGLYIMPPTDYEPEPEKAPEPEELPF